MAVFAYRAIESDHRIVCGTIIADTPRQARDLLRERELAIEQMTLQPPQNLRGLGRWLPAQHRRSVEVAAFISELSTLLGVGTPILEAIDIIALEHRGSFRGALLLLRDRVSAGASLAEAMREQPALFDEFMVHMTEVGESSGTLDIVLQRLSEFRERSGQLRGKISSALLYPCIVLVVGICVSIFLMTFVVPNLLNALASAGRPLPLATRIVKGASDFLVYRWWLRVAVLSVLAGAVGLIMRSSRSRMLWHRVQLRIPLLGPLIQKQAVVHIAVIIATLLKSGMVFLKALQIAQRSTRNLSLREALVCCETAVSGGQDIADALRSTNAFPPVVLHVFAIGQQSGRLEEMLEKLAADYSRQLSSAAQRLTAVLEPVLILLLALVVGFIAFATILPILEASNAI